MDDVLEETKRAQVGEERRGEQSVEGTNQFLWRV